MAFGRAAWGILVDKIYVSRLPLMSLVGVYSHEKKNPQPLYLDLELSISLAKAAKSDDLDDTLDYSALCRTIQAAAEAYEHCNLIESRLTELVEIALENEQVESVIGRLYKPGAVPGAEISVERALKR